MRLVVFVSLLVWTALSTAIEKQQILEFYDQWDRLEKARDYQGLESLIHPRAVISIGTHSTANDLIYHYTRQEYLQYMGKILESDDPRIDHIAKKLGDFYITKFEKVDGRTAKVRYRSTGTLRVHKRNFYVVLYFVFEQFQGRIVIKELFETQAIEDRYR